MDRAFYDRYYALEDRHWWFVGRRHIIRAEAERRLRLAAPPPGSRPEILDIGCGTGVMLGTLGELGRARGTEMEPAAVDYCRQRGIEDVEVAGTPPLPFEAESFDLITILDVLEHIEEDGRMVAEIGRLLRPGGTMIATVPAFPSLWGPQDDISHHRRRYLRSTLTETIERGGLRLERISYFNTLLFPPIAVFRLLRRLRPPPEDLASDFELTPSGRVNDVLSAVFKSEGRWLAKKSFPFGVSLLAVATRP